MKRMKYKAEFKEEAVKQVINKVHAVVDVSKRPQSDASRDGQTQG